MAAYDGWTIDPVAEEGAGGAVADFKTGYAFPDGHHFSGAIRQHDVVGANRAAKIFAKGYDQVTVVERAGFHLHQDLSWSGRGFFNVHHLQAIQRSTAGLDDKCFHGNFRRLLS